MSNRREYHRNYMQRRRAQQRLGIKIIKPSEGKALVMDSRQVAELVEKRHDLLLRDIRRYIEVLEASSNLRTPDFFIPSTYEDAQGKDRPSFLLTKQGCEMVANKMTGEKGILFTATYVSRFNEMEAIINQGTAKLTSDTQTEADALEIHLKAAKLTAEIMGADKATLLQMVEAVHEHHGIPTNHLFGLKEGV